MTEKPGVLFKGKGAFPLFEPLRSFLVWGPGLLVMLADTDVGNVVAAYQSGSLYGFRLLPLLFLLIPPLAIIQELTVRLGIFTQRGHGELLRLYFGPVLTWLSIGALGIATIGTLITEFTGIAGIGELYGLDRVYSLPLAAGALLLVVVTGSYRRVERTALFIGLFELAFFAVAWRAGPSEAVLVHDLSTIPWRDPSFLYLGAGLIGAVFNPWMIFYQQSAVVEKGLRPADWPAARWDTIFGAVLTQTLTAAILVSAASTLASQTVPMPLGAVGDIAKALTPLLGPNFGRLIFAIGVLGAAMVAAIIASLALAWGLGEVTGHRRSLEYHPLASGWFGWVYGLAVVGSAGLVWLVPNLVWLNITAQVVNVFLLPIVIGLLVTLARRALPFEQQLRGGYLWLVCFLVVALSLLGIAGGLTGAI